MSDESLAGMALAEAKERMEKAVAHTQAEFLTIRTGRATPAVIENLRVSYYGTETPLKQLAGFQVPEARQLLISPYDKGSLKDIERAIQGSDLGISPSNDGSVIRLNFPPLTEERRKQMVKLAKGKGEDGKVAVRNSRRDVRKDLEALEKAGDLSTDELERAQKDLDKLTKDFESEIDRMVAHKEAELLEV